MNTSIIRYIVGYILKIEAALLLIPSIVAAIYRRTGGVMLSFCFRSVHLPWCTPLFPKTEKSCFLFKRRLCCHILKLDCTQFFWFHSIFTDR